MLNIDYKILSKVLAQRLKEVLPKLISSNQTAYVKNCFIGENLRLISDILEVADTLDMEAFLVTIDMEKAFDSLSHAFLLAALKKYNFGEKYISWINREFIKENGKNPQICIF